MNLHLRIEGTAAEIGDFLRTLPGAATIRPVAVELTTTTGEPPVKSETPPNTDSRFVTTQFARRALRRLSLSKPVQETLRALYEAHPEWLSLKTLQDAAGYKPAQFAGLMGAFGRRLANTEGYDPDVIFFEYKWDQDNETAYYRIPDSVREALALEELI